MSAFFFGCYFSYLNLHLFTRVSIQKPLTFIADTQPLSRELYQSHSSFPCIEKARYDNIVLGILVNLQ